MPTEVGMIVTDFLVNNFQNILNYNFTASVEQDFDKIANGDIEWTSILKDFYGPFHLQLRMYNKMQLEKLEKEFLELIQ